MTDYNHDLLFGISIPPTAADQEAVVETATLAEEVGLDLVGFQDHPYQAGFLDAWTILAYLAGRTRRVGLFPNVLNVPLRPAAVLARGAISLDILSGGRLELGLGAGFFLDGIRAMGGPERSLGGHVEALAEAITVIRSLSTEGPPVTFRGDHYRLQGARPGPLPRHPLRIWLGAYKRRMLQLTGRAADGWIPSLGYADPGELAGMNRTIDEAAEDAGRRPAEIRRGFNISGSFGAGVGFLKGSPAIWAEQLAELALDQGISAFVLATRPDAALDLRRFAEEVAPEVREAVGRERNRPRPAPVDEAPRLQAEEPIPVGRAAQETLLAIHEHLRQELERLRDVIAEVADGRSSAAEARSYLNQMTLRQNYWTLGAFCAAYCRVVSVHHAIEDQRLFPDLKAADQSLGPILDRLRHEHEGIAKVLGEVDDALVAMIEDENRLASTQAAVDNLRNLLLVHLAYEEQQLLEPIGRLGILI